MRRVAIALLLSACTTWKLDSSQPIADVSGPPPSMDGRQRILWKSGTDLSFILGPDGTEWAAFTPSVDSATSGPPIPNTRLVRLGDPASEEEWPAEYVTLGASAVYETLPLPGMVERWSVTVSPPGEADQARKFIFEGSVNSVVPSPKDDAFLVYRTSFDQNGDALKDLLVRSDDSHTRELPLYEGPGAFSDDGALFFFFDQKSNLQQYSTLDDSSLVLGTLAEASGLLPLPIVDQRRQQVIVCDDTGLWAFPFSSTAARQIDPSPCYQFASQPSLDWFVYSAGAGGEIRSVPLDGSSAPAPMSIPAGALRIALAPTAMAYAVDYLAMRYSPDASDGWVDGRRFMERGRYVNFTADGTRLLFVEHAASGTGVGELRSYHRDTGALLPLARNSFRWKELLDGRVLASSNMVDVGDYNRVVVIDESRASVEWVAGGGGGWTLVPNQREALITLASVDDDKTLVRMPIPERR
jgi:hypothetical protein